MSPHGPGVGIEEHNPTVAHHCGVRDRCGEGESVGGKGGGAHRLARREPERGELATGTGVEHCRHPEVLLATATRAVGTKDD